MGPAWFLVFLDAWVYMDKVQNRCPMIDGNNCIATSLVSETRNLKEKMNHVVREVTKGFHIFKFVLYFSIFTRIKLKI